MTMTANKNASATNRAGGSKVPQDTLDRGVLHSLWVPQKTLAGPGTPELLLVWVFGSNSAAGGPSAAGPTAEVPRRPVAGGPSTPGPAAEELGLQW
uniref:Uncharacterized protein n=1 Tax=Gopherus agassizii TaxID=38772 RepID=A0A452INQ9_9SAUR